MATRNFYIGLSRRFAAHHDALKLTLFGFMFAAFALILAVHLIFNLPGSVLGYAGRLWFSATAILGVLWLATGLFNPERDPLLSSLQESWATVILNGFLIMAAIVWFMD